MSDRLTSKDYWEHSYTGRKGSRLLSTGTGSRPTRDILEVLESIGLHGKTILEAGAGDSLWIPYLAARYPDARFIGLDYAESGCALLRAKSEGLANVTVIKGDIFRPDEEMLNCADLVSSFGVVEHFSDLGATMKAIARFARAGGMTFTTIPNLSGILGLYIKASNRSIYDLHHPHDLKSFAQGHQDAGLEIVSAGYLGAINFGVASSCFSTKRSLKYQFYRSLSALSQLAWWAQDRGLRLPVTKAFSPYIYAIARLPA